MKRGGLAHKLYLLGRRLMDKEVCADCKGTKRFRCPWCVGSGWGNDGFVCEECQGTGQLDCSCD